MKNMSTMMSLLRITRVVAVLLTYISVVVAYNKTVWEIDNYPNPVTSPAECGSTESSYLCDPDGFLSTRIGNYNFFFIHILKFYPCFISRMSFFSL